MILKGEFLTIESHIKGSGALHFWNFQGLYIPALSPLKENDLDPLQRSLFKIKNSLSIFSFSQNIQKLNSFCKREFSHPSCKAA